MIIQQIYRYRFYILLGLFALTLLSAWPGFMNPDSMGQYSQALKSQYSDHHPPLMSFLWHYLDLLHQGVGLMFVLQLTLFYSGIAILMLALDRLLDTKKWPVVLLLIFPIYPQVLIYAITVVKDVQYAFCFVFVCSVLAYYTITRERIPMLVTAGLLVVLTYGAGVKYQGQFCAIVPAIWLGCLLCNNKKLMQKIVIGILIYALIFIAIGTINYLLVPQRAKSFSWQCVKLYDLAAMSVDINKDLIPQYNKTAFYTFAQLQNNFDYPSIDSCVYVKNSILRVTRDQARMNILYKAWLINVLRHPVAYIKHRLVNLSYMLVSRPGYIYSEPIINKIPHNTWIYKTVYEINSVLFYAFMSHLPVIVWGIFYFVLAIVSWRYSKAAPVLLGFTSVALLMIGLLFAMSMAGSPRYTYISIVMIHAMHAFAYVCYSDSKKVIG